MSSNGRQLLLVAALLCAAGCRRDFEKPAASASVQAGTVSVASHAPSGPRPAISAGALPAGGPSPERPAVPPRFADVARQSGIDFTYYNDAVPGRFFLPEVMGGGLAWMDFDGDGRLDLFIANGCPVKDPDPHQREHTSRLYRNLGHDRFEDVTLASGAWDNGFGQGCAVGDYDADGFPDLFLANYGADALLHNNGDGTFTKVSKAAGTSDPDWSSSAVWFDADGDGLLDLYVATYLNATLANHRAVEYNGLIGYPGPSHYEAVPDHLYVNQGDGTFRDALESYGMAAPDGKGLTVAVLDLDDDLRPEIYVGNDMAASFLFTRGDSPLAKAAGRDPLRRYAEVGTLAGCAVSGEGLNEANMGVACADFDGDGLTDLYVTHYYNAKNTLFHNLGNLSFVDDSYSTRVAAISKQSLGFGTAAIDYDRDGAADLFVANGHVLGHNIQPCLMKPQLLHNDGRGRFDEVSPYAGAYFQELLLGRGVAAADYDDDGDLDLAVSHLERPVALLRNDTPTRRHFIGFDLRTHHRVRPAGGRVVVASDKRRWVMPVVAGGSYLSSSDPRLVFGLADEPGPVSAEIFWPSGRVDKFERLGVDGYWMVVEGEAPEPAPRFPAG